MTNGQLFQGGLKTLGLLPLNNASVQQINSDAYRDFIKVLFLPQGYRLQVDLSEYTMGKPSLFFVGPGQHLHLLQTTTEGGYFVYYNRDFYCIQIHDNEVACDGLLYNNIQDMPAVLLDEAEMPFFSYIFSQMADEFGLKDPSLEEMLRTYLKQLFIKSARLWKKQNLNELLQQQNKDLEFFRKFTILVEEHYRQKHNVADYAELMFVAPKTITHNFKRLNLPQPNDIIKSRIVMQAKRLLAHTSLSAKEIAYELGYDDPAYFSRLFAQKTGETPSGFRNKFLAGI